MQISTVLVGQEELSAGDTTFFTTKWESRNCVILQTEKLCLFFLSRSSSLSVKAPIKADLSEMELEGPELLLQIGKFQVSVLLPVNQHILLCFKESHFAAPAVLWHF